MNIKKNLTELIGNTPLLAITRLGEELQGAEVIAKLEYFNPGGSVKDRAAFFLIEDAEKKGLLKPGAMIIEPTSGNTGVGLAWVASVKGYKLVLTMPETMSLERRSLLKALGAQLVLTPGSEGMSGAIRKAEEIREATPGAIILQQFDNPANPLAHERTTAEEIWRDTDGKVDIFVASVGTGGTLTGTARGLKRHNPSIRAIAVEPASSPVLSGGKAGPPPHRHSQISARPADAAAGSPRPRNSGRTHPGLPRASPHPVRTPRCGWPRANPPDSCTRAPSDRLRLCAARR